MPDNVKTLVEFVGLHGQREMRDDSHRLSPSECPVFSLCKYDGMSEFARCAAFVIASIRINEAMIAASIVEREVKELTTNAQRMGQEQSHMIIKSDIKYGDIM